MITKKYHLESWIDQKITIYGLGTEPIGRLTISQKQKWNLQSTCKAEVLNQATDIVREKKKPIIHIRTVRKMSTKKSKINEKQMCVIFMEKLIEMKFKANREKKDETFQYLKLRTASLTPEETRRWEHGHRE